MAASQIFSFLSLALVLFSVEISRSGVMGFPTSKGELDANHIHPNENSPAIEDAPEVAALTLHDDAGVRKTRSPVSEQGSAEETQDLKFEETEIEASRSPNPIGRRKRSASGLLEPLTTNDKIRAALARVKREPTFKKKGGGGGCGCCCCGKK